MGRGGAGLALLRCLVLEGFVQVGALEFTRPVLVLLVVFGELLSVPVQVGGVPPRLVADVSPRVVEAKLSAVLGLARHNACE
jgi:hypothetical protein